MELIQLNKIYELVNKRSWTVKDKLLYYSRKENKTEYQQKCITKLKQERDLLQSIKEQLSINPFTKEI